MCADGAAMFNPSSHDPLEHGRAVSICPACDAPNIPGVDCFCVDYTLDDCGDVCCSTCGSAPGDYVARCPECRAMGRVSSSLVSYFDRVLTEPPFAGGQPVTELRAEEPLPTMLVERPRSWWPAVG
jgi:hypothetical protein